MSFTGTLDKCKACDKTVYFVDLLSADGVTYHKSCFKCSHCKGTLVVCMFLSRFLFLNLIFHILLIVDCVYNLRVLKCYEESSWAKYDSNVSVLVNGRWAITPPWMEFSTASLISSNFSRSLEISARTFRHVRYILN